MKNKKQKKLVVLAAMGALLALVGVSGSQTYAKYIEETNVPAQSATVAKWGFVAKANVANLFVTAHDKDVVELSTKKDGYASWKRTILVIVE